MELMLTPIKLFVLLKLFKFVETNWTRVLSRIHRVFCPRSLWNWIDLTLTQTFRNLPVIFLQLENLLVSHIIHVRDGGVCILFWFLYGPLNQSLFLSLRRIGSDHWAHHDLHHHFSLPLPGDVLWLQLSLKRMHGFVSLWLTWFGRFFRFFAPGVFQLLKLRFEIEVFLS